MRMPLRQANRPGLATFPRKVTVLSKRGAPARTRMRCESRPVALNPDLRHRRSASPRKLHHQFAKHSCERNLRLRSPSALGSLRDSQLKRDGQAVTNFDLCDLLVRGDKSKDVPLVSGDVIYFPPVGPQVAVVGSVQTPAIYELHD
jgi:hypothetical protein